VFVPHTVFRPSSDMRHATWVEEQIARLGKRQAYRDALIHDLRLEEHVLHEAVAAGYPAPEEAPVVQRALMHATPVQRCRAAMAVVKHAAAQ
jgi:hypothetical protein